MENKKPEFGLEHSVISIVSELHSYFRDLQSYYKIAQADIVSKLESTQDKQKQEELQAKFKKIKEKIDYFHVLNDAISIADVVLHTEGMIEELGEKKKT
jgi:hypothetical protein